MIDTRIRNRLYSQRHGEPRLATKWLLPRIDQFQRRFEVASIPPRCAD